MSNDGDWLKALWTMGLILLVVTTLPGAIMLIYAFLTHTNIGVDAGVYTMGSLLMSGIVAMVYASIKGNRRNRNARNNK
jgi:hypothetical protein